MPVVASSAIIHRTRSLAILVACYSFAYADRSIINLMIDPIREATGASDDRIAFLIGPSFSISYLALGLFAGRAADRFNRKRLLIAAALFWSAATLASALGHGLGQLTVARMVVGAAEALIFPCGLSLLADLFDSKRLPFATAVFLLAPHIGTGIAMISGGLILRQADGIRTFLGLPSDVIADWQLPFAFTGAVSMLLVVALALLDDPRGANLPAEKSKIQEERRSLRDFSQSWHFYLTLFVAMAGMSILLHSFSAWVPTMLVRDFGMRRADAAIGYGMLVICCGIAGALLSPLIHTGVSRYSKLAPLYVIIFAAALCTCIGAFLLVAPSNSALVFACILALTVAYNIPFPMAALTLQLTTPPRLRGTASGFYFVITGVLAIGLGPVVVSFLGGMFSHHRQPLLTALGTLTVVSSVFAILLLLALRSGYRSRIAERDQC